MKKVLKQDIQDFCAAFPLKNELSGASFLITGATGLIGSTLIRCLLALNKNIRILAPVRNIEKARKMYDNQMSGLTFFETDLLHFHYESLGKVDYVIHCAAPTASKFFVNNPVETATTIFSVTARLLDYCRHNKVCSFVYLSSLEVYGTINDDSTPVDESVQGYLDPLDVRSSYPMAKRAAENLCVDYQREYGVPARIARLTQTTGAGISMDDNRVIAQFARLAADGEDIVLHTKGDSARPYCYTTDAVSALLYIAQRGQDGQAYNVANEATYISAYDMAMYLKVNFNPAISVRMEISDGYGYAAPTKLRLSAQRLRNLGWCPQYGLKEIFARLTDYLSSR